MARSKKYTEEEIFKMKCDDYFKYCDKKKKPYTMSGLALYLDMDRRSLLNYSKDEKFFPTIKKARDRVENFVEERLFDTRAAGIIFNLKNNFGWIEEQKINHTANVNNYAGLTEEELRKLASEDNS